LLVLCVSPIEKYFENNHKMTSNFFLSETNFVLNILNTSCYLCKALYTLDIFEHNISIKRYWDKKIKRHFSSNIFFPVCIEKFFWGQFWIFSNVIAIFWRKKKYFYRNIFLSFYHNIAISRPKMSSVYRP